jgi:predicted aspartyl protease
MSWENCHDLMMGGVLAAKYSDPGSPVVNVQINNTLISNTLIDLGASINVMTHETMQALGLTGLRETPTILQLS